MDQHLTYSHERVIKRLEEETEKLKIENQKLRATLRMCVRPGGPHMELLSSYTQAMQRLALYEHGMNEMEKSPEIFGPDARLVQRRVVDELRITSRAHWCELEEKLRQV